MMKRLGQGGFATLEVILMVTVIGILSAIAVPRFEDITAKANTARIQSDLTTIDTAIALYKMNNTGDPSTLSDLKDYLTDADSIKPPQSGKVFIGKSTADPIPATEYKITAVSADKGGGFRGTLDGKTAGEFGYKESSN